MVLAPQDHLDANEILRMAQHGYLWPHACSISVIKRFSLPYVACCRPMMAPVWLPGDASPSWARKLASAAEQSARTRGTPAQYAWCQITARG